MSTKAEAVLTLALDLPESDRAEIAAALIESLEPPAEADVEEAWRQEVARRVAAIDAGEVELIPWEQVREELYARLNERQKS
jgi:putative addiction module component (TIGR02574 family)